MHKLFFWHTKDYNKKYPSDLSLNNAKFVFLSAEVILSDFIKLPVKLI